MKRWQWQALILSVGAAALASTWAQTPSPQWLAGDSHIHSHWSPGYDTTRNPPLEIKGADGRYATPLNAQKAREYGLAWMVTTDHGGPNHAKFNLEEAYPELLESRRLVPQVLQFYGLELNMPAMDHHTLIIPNSEQEAAILHDIESRFDSRNVWPLDPARNSESQARSAIEHLAGLPRLPIVFANHPSRSAKGLQRYGLDEPRELRANNDVAPDVYRGMEGAPGHQAAALAPDGSQRRDAGGQPTGFRGSYQTAGAHTLGGFDQMTAMVGGLWDSMLGEGRRFWIVATSDSHVHYTEPNRPGSDFWPGQYQKTYVRAQRSYDGILEGLRSGRIFVVAGDLVNALDVTATAGGVAADIGETLKTPTGADVAVTIRFRDQTGKNHNGNDPKVIRVDLIVGDITGPVQDRNTDRNPSTKVLSRWTARDWVCENDVCAITTVLPQVGRKMYLRVRGTSTTDLEPSMDVPGEDPWQDLWFYSNPIFIEPE
jgi:hypothetical protein